jgi:hypothetical protein
MISFRGFLPYSVTQPYEALLTQLNDAADKSDCADTRGIANFKTGNDGRAYLDGYFHFANWPARSSSAKERVHILVHVQETICKQHLNYCLERSTVRVNYFRVENGEAFLMHGIHFDHGLEEICHPVFHAQVANDAVALPDEIAGELEFAFVLHPRPSEVFKNARIPTSDMTLPSVLLCLAADHLKAEFFPAFLSTVRELQAKMPPPIFTKTKQSIHDEPDHLRSSHWFAHTPVPPA